MAQKQGRQIVTVHPFTGGGKNTFDATDGGGGDNGEMEARVAKLEALAEKTQEQLVDIGTRLTKLETRSETFATREDVVNAKYAVVFWIVTTTVIAQVIPALPGLFRALGWLH
jgi:hypothetical protein